MIIAFTAYYTKAGTAQSVGIMEVGSETIAHYWLFFLWTMQWKCIYTTILYSDSQ